MHASTRLALALFIASPCAGASAQAAPPVVASAAYNLDADVQRVLTTFDVPGIAIAVVKDGKVVATRGFGVRKLGDPAPVDSRTLFQIASNSKAFTAAALALLVDEGKLAWDDPVTRHLPGFQMYDGYVTHEMTVRDLLTHRSGLGLGAGDLLWWPTTSFSTDEIIEKLRYIKPATSFRSAYAYDNLLYIVAGKIIAAKSGKTWGETIHEKILAPVGMTGTTTSLAEGAAQPNQAGAHSKINDRIALVPALPVENAAGAVGINTNAVDIAKWMQVLLDSGKIASRGAGPDGQPVRLYSDARAADLWSAQTPIRIPEPPAPLAATRPNFSAYALGFQLRDYHGQKVAMHGGALVGFYSRVLLVPESKLGIAIFTNAESGGALTALQYRLLDAYMTVAPTPTSTPPAPPADWIGIVGAQEKAMHAQELARVGAARTTRAAASTPSLALTAYDGVYQDAWYGTATIRHEGKQQTLTFGRTPALTGVLEHFQHDTFIVRWKARSFNADAYVTFALNPDGSIERMRMAPVSTETDFSYDFQDLLFVPVKAGTRPSAN